MLSEIVHILRVTGILFCLMHANNFYAMLRQLRLDKEKVITIIGQIGDNSLLLFSGALLILISLKLQEGLQAEDQRGEMDMPSWPLPGFYLVTRPFVLVLACLYLIIAPVTVLEAQTIRNGLLRPIDAAYIRQRDEIERLEVMTRANGSIDQFSEKLNGFLGRYKFDHIVMPANLSEARVLIPLLREESDLLRKRQSSQATRSVSWRTNRLILQSLLQFLILFFFWLNWPRRNPAVIRKARASMQRGLL